MERRDQLDPVVVAAAVVVAGTENSVKARLAVDENGQGPFEQMQLHPTGDEVDS